MSEDGQNFMLETAATAGKVGALVGRPAIALVRRQLNRRGAEIPSAATPASVEPELREALSVLRRKGETPFGGPWAWIKAFLSDRPIVFDDDQAQDWLTRDDVQTLLVEATIALVANLDLTRYEAEAKRLYGISSEEASWYGAPLFDYAVAFMAMSLKGQASFDTRLTLATDNTRAAAVDEKLSEIAADIKDLKQANTLIGEMSAAKQVPVELIDGFIEREVNRREALRAIVDPKIQQSALDLGARAFDGDLSAASPPVKIQLYCYVAAILAREPNPAPDEAELWLSRARDVGANDLASDMARIALARSDHGEALRLLAGREDPLGISLTLEAINRRDGTAEALDYFEKFQRPDQVTGFFISTLAHWLASERSIAVGEALLAEASEAQLTENRTLRFVRMRMRLALCSPMKIQAEMVRNHAMLPPITQLRNDSEGLRLREQALVDAEQLSSDLKGSAPDDFFRLIEITRLFLALLSPHPDIVARAKAELTERLTDPSSRAIYAPLAMPFGIEFDRQALERQLDQAERLNGWDDAELRAALDMAVHADDPDRIVKLVEKYRDRLIILAGPAQAIGILVEALVEAGRPDEARAKLAGGADQLSEEERRFLADLIETDRTQSAADVHLARFQASDSDQDLLLLVSELHTHRDRRLADYAHKLWSRRNRLDDALITCNGFALAGRFIELRDFLAELGDSVELDPGLRAHKAWILFREGRLKDAAALTSELRANSPDNSSLRQLEINIAIEGGGMARPGRSLQAGS
ncbi:hypothetical protein M2333_002660 [Sphingobium sp. B11D3B]|uniref:hypothetical protein n=1 Tax=Sphingobium sp. B11D3B TaxID=2940575 RepID=UPI002226768B|nr:hypothetical protein [Sphingobium sp. B11D3B]MCW2389614.1 hypothetical protein [Sphingobium sp. B11D3B]